VDRLDADEQLIAVFGDSQHPDRSSASVSRMCW
jgi:hypothetical protein